MRTVLRSLLVALVAATLVATLAPGAEAQQRKVRDGYGDGQPGADIIWVKARHQWRRVRFEAHAEHGDKLVFRLRARRGGENHRYDVILRDGKARVREWSTRTVTCRKPFAVAIPSPAPGVTYEPGELAPYLAVEFPRKCFGWARKFKFRGLVKVRDGDGWQRTDRTRWSPWTYRA